MRQGPRGKTRRGNSQTTPFFQGLFFQGFLAFFAGAVLILGSLTFFLYWGVSQSIQGWNQQENRTIQQMVHQVLIELVRMENTLKGSHIEKALQGKLSSSAFVYVEDVGGTVVYLYRQGEVVRSETGSGFGKNFLRRHGKELEFQELREGGTYWGRYAAGTLGFEMTESNAQFLANIERSAVVGILVSLVLAFGVGFGFSRRIATQSRIVAEGLTRISEGRRDVTFPPTLVKELQSIAQNAELLQSQLTREENLRRQWSSDIAHDLRTPVSALRGQLEGILDGVLPATADRLQKIYREVLRMQSLVQDLGELSRIESPEFEPTFTHVSPSKLFADLSSRFEVLAGQMGCTLKGKWNIESIWADEKLLFRALSNLVQNALQYGNPGDIEVDFESCGEDICIQVANPGTIPEERVPLLFSRMYRGDSSRNAEGTGLGLAIVEAIANALLGRVEFQNTPEGKSLFRILLHKNFTQPIKISKYSQL